MNMYYKIKRPDYEYIEIFGLTDKEFQNLFF